MKTFLGLRGLFLLFSMIWTCAQDWSAVQVQCTSFWFYARIKPTLFHNLYMNPDEAFLGDDCPVTGMWRDVYYEFFYHPRDCGIIIKTLQETLLLKTKIKYISRNSSDRAEMPLLCVVRNQYPLLTKVERRDNKTSSAAKWEIKTKAIIANEDAEVAFITRPWENLNVIFPCVSNDGTLLREKTWVVHPSNQRQIRSAC
uniref:Oocyte secreted protein 1 n=1 Tax=Equus caballus TaxID=9796 RepID=A0A3Q2H045_HORSE